MDHWEIAASSDMSDVEGWWANAPFSVLLATGHLFDVIETPARIGVPAVRDGGVGPVAVTPDGRWMFLVQPGHALRPELADQLDVVLHSHGSWIPAPPTRTPRGRVRWEISPAGCGWRLPDPYEVQQTLLADPAATRPEPTFTTAFGSRPYGLNRAA